MAVDNTHTKYLKGADKKAWNGYKEAYEAQKKLENFMSGFSTPTNLKAGEEIEIPIRRDAKVRKTEPRKGGKKKEENN